MSATQTQSKLANMRIGGGTYVCPPEGFAELVKTSMYCEGTLEGVGTFYLQYNQVPSPGETRSQAKVTFYNEGRKSLHKSNCSIFVPCQPSRSKMTVIDQNTFLLENALMTLDEKWDRCHYREFDPQTAASMAERLCGRSGLHTSVHKTGMAQIHRNAESDFTLKSEDGKEIKVHKTVLEGLWPFFRGMVESNMKEVAQKCVKLPIPNSTLDVMVRYFYGENLELGLDDAANLIVAAQMYDLPELLNIAITKVKSEELEMSQAVYVWQKSFEAQNDDLRSHASKRIEKLMPETDNFDDAIQHLAKKQLVCLLQDISTAMSSKRQKVA